MTRVITVPSGALREQVDRAIAVVPSAGFQPVLKNLKVQARPGSLRISATDLDLAVITESPLVGGGEGDWEPLEFIIPAQPLREILREVPETGVQITVAEPAEGVTVVTIRAAGSSWSLQVPEGNFPALPDVSTVTWADFPCQPFLDAVRAVRFAASKDGANLGLACVSITVGGNGAARVTASDSGRVQQAPLASFPVSVQIPAIGSPAAVDEVTRLLSRNEDITSAQVALTEGHLLFRAGAGVFACRKLTVPGANVEQQILNPAIARNKLELTVARGPLLDAIRKVAITADDTSSAICLALSQGKLTLISRDKAGNYAEASLDASWGSKPRSVVVSHRHLAAAVSAASGTACAIRLADSGGKRSAVLILDEAGVHGVIPQLTGKYLGYE